MSSNPYCLFFVTNVYFTTDRPTRPNAKPLKMLMPTLKSKTVDDIKKKLFLRKHLIKR